MGVAAYAYSFGKLHAVYFLLLRTYQLATSNTRSRSQLSSDIQRAFWFEISAYGCFLLNFKYGEGICPVFRAVCVPPLGSAIPFR